MEPKRIAIFLAFALFIVASAQAATFQVEHDHVFGSCKGKLIFGDTTVQYETPKTGHARIWKYEDIQQLEISPGRLSVLTYEDSKVGGDRAFHFKVLSGELNDSFRREMESKLSRPLVSSIVPAQSNVRFTIPVRHRGFMHDSHGVLEFAEDLVVYRTEKPKDSRMWRYDELLSFGSTGPFQLRIGALQKAGGEYGEEKNYVFDLKRRLQRQEYDFIWEKINRREISNTNSFPEIPQ